MKINVRTIFKDMKGNDILSQLQGNGAPIPLTFAEVLQQTLLAQAHPPGSTYTPDQSVKRYLLATEIEKATSPDSSGEIEIDASMASTLQNDIPRHWGPIVAGQIVPALDGK